VNQIASLSHNGRVGKGRCEDAAVRAPASVDDVVRVATGHYLAGRPIDMSGLAAEVGIGRATLYRRVGQHENLMGLVLAGRTAATFARADAATPGAGPARVRAVIGAFIQAAVDAAPLRALVARDPVLFARVVMAPGHVEDTATNLVAALIETEMAADGVRVPADRLARAVVRVGDSFMYAHLLSGGPSQVPEALAIIDLLLGSATTGRRDGPGQG
jgi:AcrR family transcriptional regulator